MTIKVKMSTALPNSTRAAHSSNSYSSAVDLSHAKTKQEADLTILHLVFRKSQSKYPNIIRHT
jgi:hypothetical protein